MPADVVNLRRARKRHQRDVAEREAEANRVRHGTPKAMRDGARIQRKRDTQALDGLKLDRQPPAGPPAPASDCGTEPENGKPS